MDFSDLLQKKEIDPEHVLVLRHRPFEPELNKILPWFAAERPDVFNAYQQAQGEKLERAMMDAKYIASFIGHKPAKALFVGLYLINGSKPITQEEYWQIPANIEMKKFGMKGFTDEDVRPSLQWFDLVVTEFYDSWKGRLVVNWPPPERSWWRRGHRNNFAIAAILEDSALIKDIPEWDTMVFKHEQLDSLPTKWRAALSQWRGIYYIFDTFDGKAYVGSAYGDDNLLGRWLNYSASGHGGNASVRNRDQKGFLFSILQRVSPDKEPDKVIKLESTWKDRLHTRAPHGLNDN